MWEEFKINEQIKIRCIHSLFENECYKGFLFKGESHNFWECVYVEKGCIEVTADERVYKLCENEIIFHKPMELHKLNATESDAVKLFIFSFSAEGNALNFFKDKVFALNDSQQNIIKSFIEYARSKVKTELQTRDFGFYELYLQPFRTSTTYSQLVSSYIQQLMLMLCDDGLDLPAEKSDDALIFQKAIRFMERNINIQPTITEIARFCEISQTGIKRVFSKFSGMGVHKYFTVLRVQAAAELLKEGVSVTQIAEKLGFGSQGYFSAVFKRELGQTPTEFKNSLK